MPFVTEYNTNLVFKKLIGEIPENIREWQPYKKSIYFLNRLDKTNLLYFKKFCENPIENIDMIYKPIEITDNQEFVYEGSNPSYHKYENCDRLSSNFINYRIPTEIKKRGDEAIEEYRKWFKENEKVFSERPDIYQMRLQTKFGIIESIQKVNYKNSGNVYKENLTLSEIESRIDSLLFNAAQYYKDDKKRQQAVKRYQTATFLAFKEDEIIDNETNYSDEDLKVILREYYYLFIEPTIYYLKEFFKVFYNADIEINEKIFEQLNFKKCGYCYSEKYESESQRLAEKVQVLKKRFGDFEFPIEPTVFHFQDIPDTNIRVAFIYCRVFKLIDSEFQSDEKGRFKRFKIEFINHKNKFLYKESKIYEIDILDIELFRKYITKIEQNKTTREATYTTFPYEI
jgi:hypothetical protein